MKRGKQFDTHMDNHFLSRFAQYNTSLTPREIIHLPERVQGKEERERGDGKDVEQHPANHVPFAAHDEDEGLQTINCGDHDERQCRNGFAFSRNEVDQVDDLKRRRKVRT